LDRQTIMVGGQMNIGSWAALDTAFMDLLDLSYKTAGSIYMDDNPGSSTCNRSMATNKN
jgi:hypothetical protein